MFTSWLSTSIIPITHHYPHHSLTFQPPLGFGMVRTHPHYMRLDHSAGVLLIPKSELMLRSPSAPRSQPISSYPLYSSLVFHCSQVPISVAAKHLTQPRFPSLPCSAEMLTISTSQVIFPRMVMRQLCSIFRPQVSWWPEVKYIGRIILHQQSPFNSYIFYSPVPVSTPLTLTIPILLDPRSCDLSSSDYYSSMISLV